MKNCFWTKLLWHFVLEFIVTDSQFNSLKIKPKCVLEDFYTYLDKENTKDVNCSLSNLAWYLTMESAFSCDQLWKLQYHNIPYKHPFGTGEPSLSEMCPCPTLVILHFFQVKIKVAPSVVLILNYSTVHQLRYQE